jgi:endonuclease/exonuclease/phosphatase family metal-dependent hydrolase
MAFSRAFAATLAALLVTAACKSRKTVDTGPESAPPKQAQGELPRAAEDVPAWWVSPEDCRRALEARPPRRKQGRARIGTWNIRWFPDAEAGDERERKGTNVEWLACGIAQLDVDVLAVQEFKDYPEAKQASEQLTIALDRHTGGRWKLELEKCGKPEAGHVGLLWNTARVKARDFWESNELLVGKPCDLDWRPGLAGYFEFPGGFDAHIVALHAVAGESRERMEARQSAFRSFGQLQRAAFRRHADADLILVGDFNTSGCDDCEPKRSSGWEVEQLRELLQRTKPALRLVPPTVACSEYHGNEPYLLDHFAVSSTTRELAADARAVVDGYCVESKCSSDYDQDQRDIYDDISDHCPLVLELTDRDLD